MISITTRGSFKNTDAFLNRMQKLDIATVLKTYGERGVAALRDATPYDTGNSAGSWDYEVVVSQRAVSITWTNSNVQSGIPVVILLQYGHGTGTGGYVQGRDFINPALKPIFDEIADKVWKAVTSA